MIINKINFRKYFNPQDIYTALIVFVCLLLIGRIFQLAFDLRPIADDYCVMANTNSGPIAATIDYFKTVNGDIWAMFMFSTLVGWSLNLFGYDVGSAIPFLLLVIVLSVSLPILTLKKKMSNPPYLIFAFISLSSALSWFIFWGGARLISSGFRFQHEQNLVLMSEAILHWKTVQVTYLFIPFSLLLGLYLLNSSKLTRFQKAFFTMFLMFLIGVSGYIFAVSVVLTWFLFSMYISRDLKISLKNCGAVFLPLIAGLFVSFFSQGSQNRKRALVEYPQLEITFYEGVRHLILTFASLFLNLGTLLSFFCGIAIYVILIPNRGNLDFAKIKYAQRLTTISVVSCFIVTAAANHYVGWSPWHMLTAFGVAWLWTVLSGMRFANKFINISHKSVSLPILLAALFILLSYKSVGVMGKSIEDRLARWDVGAASTAGIVDREVDWVNACILRSDSPPR